MIARRRFEPDTSAGLGDDGPMSQALELEGRRRSRIEHSALLSS
jgi:hypothetical protein